MSALVEHWAEMSTLLIMLVGIVTTWVKLKDRIEALDKLVMDTREHFDTEIERIEGKIDSDLMTCHAERGKLVQSVAGHHENHQLHITTVEREMQTEWRHTVLAKLDRLERLILKLNGGV